jgi:hypothetical protein
MLKDHYTDFSITKTMLDTLTKFGNLIQPCPIKPGHYYLKEGRVDDSLFPKYLIPFNNTRYKTHVVFMDENMGAKKVFEYNTIVMIVK